MKALTHSSIQPFFDYLRFEKRYSVHTLTSYQADLSDFISHLEGQFGIVKLQEIDHQFIRSWLAHLKERGLSSRSINRKISTLKSFFKYYLKTGEIEASPMAKITSPRSGKRLPVFVKEEDTARLLEVLSQATDDWKRLNAKMLITIFYTTGMRLSELLNLKEKQIDLQKGQIRVLGKGNKERVLPVPEGLGNLIRNYREQKTEQFADHAAAAATASEYLLVTEKGKKIYPKYAWLLVNEYLGKTSTLGKKGPHVLRHTFATHLVNNGAGLNAVKELLGHSSLAATQVYTHNTIEKLKDIHKKAHPKS